MVYMLLVIVYRESYYCFHSQLLDWYDHPEACKYIDSNNNVTSENSSSPSSADSPEISSCQPLSLNSYAKQQVDGALKDFETINKVGKIIVG